MEDEALVAAFMDATGCGREDAFDRLARCSGHLGNAINSFFSIDAGPSSRSRPRSPPTSPPPQGPPAVSARRPNETRVVSSSSNSSRRRERRRRLESRLSREGGGGGGGREPEDGNRNRSRRRRFREYSSSSSSSSSDGEEEAEANNRRRRRQRLNPTEPLSDSEGENKRADDTNIHHRFRESINMSSDDDDDNYMLAAMVDAARPAKQPPPPPRNNNDSTFEELFHAPQELAFRGGFHAAMAHAARRARWLLASVQSQALAPLPALHQNRDVWGNNMVAHCVRDRFVLWQADAGGDGDESSSEEGKKVLAYYKVPHDHKLPAVVVVDPVTGQAMDVLRGSAACDLNDFMVRIGPYTDASRTVPIPAAKSCTAVLASAPPAGARRSNTRPATTTTATTTAAPTSSGCAQQAPTTVEEKVCKLRVRLADGRVVTKEFGSQCPVAALFAYCRSMLDAGGAPPEKPFRLMRFVGRETEEIGNQNASFESMGLHMTTVSVHLG